MTSASASTTASWKEATALLVTPATMVSSESATADEAHNEPILGVPASSILTSALLFLPAMSASTKSASTTSTRTNPFMGKPDPATAVPQPPTCIPFMVHRR